jgi:hypothetical protein
MRDTKQIQKDIEEIFVKNGLPTPTNDDDLYEGVYEVKEDDSSRLRSLIEGWERASEDELLDELEGNGLLRKNVGLLRKHRHVQERMIDHDEYEENWDFLG